MSSSILDYINNLYDISRSRFNSATNPVIAYIVQVHTCICDAAFAVLRLGALAHLYVKRPLLPITACRQQANSNVSSERSPTDFFWKDGRTQWQHILSDHW
jgi:hypothetical protein